jgi:hypothetical protein
LDFFQHFLAFVRQVFPSVSSIFQFSQTFADFLRDFSTFLAFLAFFTLFRFFQLLAAVYKISQMFPVSRGTPRTIL